jgi:hypothetical protein
VTTEGSSGRRSAERARQELRRFKVFVSPPAGSARRQQAGAQREPRADTGQSRTHPAREAPEQGRVGITSAAVRRRIAIWPSGAGRESA